MRALRSGFGSCVENGGFVVTEEGVSVGAPRSALEGASVNEEYVGWCWLSSLCRE